VGKRPKAQSQHPLLTIDSSCTHQFQGPVCHENQQDDAGHGCLQQAAVSLFAQQTDATAAGNTPRTHPEESFISTVSLVVI
jgi:hypothetical protein